jgi:hypothetical protein
VQLVTAAMPQLRAGRDWSDRDQAELAAFLRTRLGARLD